MKNLFFLFAIIIIIVANGCDPVDPPQIFTVSTVVKGHGVVTPEKATVVENGIVELSIKPDFGYVIDTVKDGNIVLPSVDKFTYRDVCKDETLFVSFKFPYEKGSIEWMFSQFTWVEVEWLMYYDGYWHNFIRNDARTTFLYNPCGTVIWSFPDHKNELKSWEIKRTDTSLNLIIPEFGVQKIEFISSKEMVLSYFTTKGEKVQITYQNDGVIRFPD